MNDETIERVTNADGIIEIRDPKIDVQSIMREIRRRASARPSYDDSQANFTFGAVQGQDAHEAPHLPGKLVEQVALANRYHDAPRHARLPSGSRLGIAGRAWAFLVRRLSSRTNAHVRETIDLQVAFNSHVVRALNEIRDYLETLASTAPAIAEPTPGAPPVPVPVALPEANWDVVHHQHEFRGSTEAITALLSRYVRCFAPARRVLDAGCGRGEFLLSLRAAGVGAYGVDSSQDMVDICARHNLEVYRAEILEHLRSLPDKSLDGIFAAQIIEHFTFTQLTEFLSEAYRVLRVEGTLVCETPNPLSIVTGSINFLLDPTHVRPLHPSLIQFLCRRAGYDTVELLFSSPHDHPLATLGDDAPGLDALTLEALNHNFARLNDLLFGNQDYAVVAKR